jgi:hypothetical protein
MLQRIEISITTKGAVNALIYTLLLHEYLYALGELLETEVRRNVIKVGQTCFGKKHIVTVIARQSPRALLQNIALRALNASKRVMQIVKDFEKTGKYAV